MARRKAKQLRFNLGPAAKKQTRARKLGAKAKAQMTGRVPPIRGRGRGRINHPSGTPRSRSTRAGAVLGRQAGHMAGGFANTAHASYRATRPKGTRSLGAQLAASKGGRYAAAGAGGAVLAGAGYGLVKARVGRSRHQTNVNVVLATPQPSGGRRGRRARRRVRRDRYGRFR